MAAKLGFSTATIVDDKSCELLKFRPSIKLFWWDFIEEFFSVELIVTYDEKSALPISLSPLYD